LHPIKAALTINISCFLLSVSNLAKVWLIFMSAWKGALNSMNTIMMLNICSELPDMYMPIAFMGSCFAGAIATSQAFFNLSVSITSGEGCGRGVRVLPVLEFLDCCRAVAEVKPGGSGKVPLRGLLGEVELRSRTHWGGGGGAAIFVGCAVRLSVDVLVELLSGCWL
jgi:hypothetical protein